MTRAFTINPRKIKTPGVHVRRVLHLRLVRRQNLKSCITNEKQPRKQESKKKITTQEKHTGTNQPVPR